MVRFFTLSGRSPDTLGQLLRTHSALVRWRSLRMALVHGLAVIGGLFWAQMRWAERLPVPLRTFGSAVWVGGASVLLCTIVLELGWRLRWGRLIKADAARETRGIQARPPSLGG